MNLLCKKLSGKGFHPKHAAEVGVYLPEHSNIYDYVMDGTKCSLVEPDPDSLSRIKEVFGQRENLSLYPVALYDKEGEVELVKHGSSNFVSDLESSPAITNEPYNVDIENKLKVEAWTFDKIDDGSIDLLSVDVEGCEWYVIKHLVSKPSVISLETHYALYTNPFIGDILNWIEKNNYRVWYKDEADTVFIQDGVFQISLSDKLQLLYMNAIYLKIKKFRKWLKLAVRAKFGRK